MSTRIVATICVLMDDSGSSLLDIAKRFEAMPGVEAAVLEKARTWDGARGWWHREINRRLAEIAESKQLRLIDEPRAPDPAGSKGPKGESHE